MDSTGTEEFTILINDLFDILNAKVPPAGIRRGSPKIQVGILNYVPKYVKQIWELFCDETETGVLVPLRLCSLINCLLSPFLVLQFLKDFLQTMNRTESNKNVKLFASAQTVESLRVTLMSVLSIIDFLHSKGVNYILTASLNQDPLEVTKLKWCCL